MRMHRIAYIALPILLSAALAGCNDEQSAQGPRTTTDPATVANTAPPPAETAPPTNGTPPATLTMPPASASTPAGRPDTAPDEATGSVPAQPSGSTTR